MSTPINVLIVEDSADDAALVVDELKSSGFEPHWTRVETESAYLAGLKQLPDLILSDFALPQFSGLRAAELLRHSGLDIPFILVSGTVGEEIAVEAMRQGVTDYLLKDRVARLGSAIRRALEQHRLRAAHLAAEQQNQLQAQALEAAANAILITDTAGIIIFANSAFTTITGYSHEEAVGQNPRFLKSDKHAAAFYKSLWDTILDGRVWRGEMTNRRKDGTFYQEEMTITPIRAADGKITHFIAVKQDITRRKEAEDKLTLSRMLMDRSNDGIEVIDPETGRFLDVNETTLVRLGYTRQELLAMSVLDIDSVGINPATWSVHVAEIRRAGFKILEGRHRRKDGSTFPIEINVRYVKLDREYLIAAVRDISERKRAEEKLNLFRMLVDRSSDGIEVVDAETGRFLDVNETICQRLGYSREDMLSMSVRQIVAAPMDAAMWQKNMEEIRKTGYRVIEAHHRRKDGSSFPVEINVRYVKLDREYLIAAVRDISERKHAEEALRRSEEKFRQLAENINEVFWIIDLAKHEMLYISPGYEKIWGRTCQSLYDSPGAWAEAIHPDDRKRILHAAETKQVPGVYDEEYRIVRPDKSVRWIRDRAFPVRNQDGVVERIVGVATDITEKRKLEEEFRQAQKMEAIGQLASGVAHDFNNVLAVIMMQIGLLATGQNLSPEQRESAADIHKAAQYAANLTRQLLLFSRRQVMQPRDLDLNDNLAEIGKMLRRILGEDIKLHLKYPPRPVLVHADPSMIDQVLMNLAVNARDAMPKGGELVIEITSVEFDEFSTAQSPQARPGTFACMAVSDTGCGIPPEILPRIFEPFFTTKDVGKGTGLGLATVFGIVQQHRGWVNVYSEAGCGTTFRTYFPCLVKKGEETKAPAAPLPLRGGNETILLVEDDASLRALIDGALKRLGYQVLRADSGISALDIWKEHRSGIQLLITDLVMPGGVNGRDLAEKIKKDNPKLKVIFTSGYSAELLGNNFPVTEGVDFLSKPFELGKLAETVRNCLDKPR